MPHVETINIHIYVDDVHTTSKYIFYPVALPNLNVKRKMQKKNVE